MNMPKHERMLEIYLDRDLVGTPVFSKLYYALSKETMDGNLACLLQNDYYAWRRERSQ